MGYLTGVGRTPPPLLAETELNGGYCIVDGCWRWGSADGELPESIHAVLSCVLTTCSRRHSLGPSATKREPRCCLQIGRTARGGMFQSTCVRPITHGKARASKFWE